MFASLSKKLEARPRRMTQMCLFTITHGDKLRIKFLCRQILISSRANVRRYVWLIFVLIYINTYKQLRPVCRGGKKLIRKKNLFSLLKTFL